MKRKRTSKVLWVVLFLLTAIGITLYYVVFMSDIPITQPNVNNKQIHALHISRDTLRDHRNNPLIEMESGRFVVNENRDDPASNKIELYFERFKTTNSKPLPPILFLAGGPGSSGTAAGRSEYFFLFKELSKYGDVILLDQRGTGNSIPNLSCRNFLDLPTDIEANVRDKIMEDIVDKCEACAEEFRDMGIELSSYNSYESAVDIDELRKALDYEQWTLYGYSYGTELAQIYIKHFGNYVNKAIFAGSLGPDHGVKLPMEVENQYRALDSLIQQDRKLRAYIPDFTGLVKTVNAEIATKSPLIQLNVQDALDDDASQVEKVAVEVAATFKSSWEMTLTHDHFQMMVADQVGRDRIIPQLPSFYYRISQGDYSQVAKDLRDFRRRRMPNALFFTVNGTSRYSDERWQRSIRQTDESLFTHFGLSYSRYPEVYNAFGVSQIEGMNTPVSDSIPVLFINGSLDGRAPINQTDEIASRFPNNKRITIENVGHNELLNNEVMENIGLFIEDSLYENISIKRPLRFKPPVPYLYNLKDTLLSSMNNGSVQAAITLYEVLETQYAHTDRYDFDFGPETIDDVYDDLIEKDSIDQAIQFTLPFSKKFMNDAILLRNLAEAYFRKKEYSKAKTYVIKALEINFFDPRSQAIFESLRGFGF
ncbi:MAG: alpha/beta fold hydrolase [Bacteroidota bacterium]